MVKILITALAVLLVTTGVAATKVHESTNELLQLRTRRLFQEQVEVQEQEQIQTRIQESQQGTGQETSLQTRLMLENQEMHQTQTQIQSRELIQFVQMTGSQSGTSNQWGIENPGSTAGYDPDSKPRPNYEVQARYQQKSQQRGCP